MNNTIKSREFASILVTLICVKMLFTYPRLIMEKCENGAWLSVLVWGLAAAGVYYLTQKMYLKTGCISILAQSEAIGGKPLKMLTGLAVMVLLIANMAPLVRAFPEAIKTALLQKSSMAVISTLLTVGVVVGAYNGVCALGRVASIFLPVAAAFILGFFVILIPFYDVNNLFPAAVAKNLTAGSASLSVFSDIFAANLLLPYISGSRCVKSAGLYAVFISIISSAAILLAYCLTYPYPASTSFIVPMYQLARVVKIGVYFQRLESIFEFVWSLAIFLYTSVYLFLICDVFRRSFDFREYRPFVIPAVQILMYFVFREGSYVHAFGAAGIAADGLFTIYFALPLVFGVIYALKTRNKKV